MGDNNTAITPERRAELLEIIRNFRLMDDTLMSKVFEDKACAKLLLRIILGRDDLTVQEAITQYELKNIQGRSAKLDIYAVDNKGKQYDIEVQRSDEGGNPKRARYNSSLLDTNSLLPGEKCDNLPESYVIFITEHNVLNGGKPLYTINRTISEMNNAIFADESHIIYVNGEARTETALGELMQDFFCNDPDKMHYKVLSRRAGYFKEDKEGVDTMCKLMEDYAEKRAKEAATEKPISFALNLLNSGMRDLEQIASLVEFPLDEVKNLFESNPA